MNKGGARPPHAHKPFRPALGSNQGKGHQPGSTNVSERHRRRSPRQRIGGDARCSGGHAEYGPSSACASRHAERGRWKRESAICSLLASGAAQPFSIFSSTALRKFFVESRHATLDDI